jgi:hypothetical protein
MKSVVSKHQKVMLVLGLILLAAALVWAAAELSGQANQLAQDSGSNSADMEMLSVDTVKAPQKTKDAPKPPNCDWAKEKSLKSSIKANDAQYKSLRAKAKSELAGSGKVSGGTRSAVMASAADFKKLNEQYAAMWDACNCKSRAKVARKAGDSRVKSAEVLVSDQIDDGKLDAMGSAQDELKSARRDYASEASAGGEISDADKSDLQNNVVPQIKTLLKNTEGLVGGTTKLFKDVQSGVSGATSGGLTGLTGLAKKAASGAKDGGASSLLKPVKALMSLAGSMLDGVKSLLSDAQSLISGKAAAGAAASAVSGGRCFIETAAE